jgi:hypothetical protein
VVQFLQFFSSEQTICHPTTHKAFSGIKVGLKSQPIFAEICGLNFFSKVEQTANSKIE